MRTSHRTSRSIRTVMAAGLLAVAPVILLPGAGAVRAETTAVEAVETLPPQTVPPEPFLDREAASALGQFGRWRNRMKSEHFTTYLAVYTALTAALTGVCLSVLAFRFGDPMSPYRRVRNSSLGLSLAIGAGLGVMLAVFEVPHARPDRVTLLLLAVLCALAATLVGAAVGFYVQRFIRIRRARSKGVAVTDRLLLR